MLYTDRGRLYQPAITRLPSLLSLFLVTLSLIALTEFACRRLPALKQKGIFDTAVGRLNGRDLDRSFLDARDPANSILGGTIPQGTSPSADLPLVGQVTETAAISNLLPLSPPISASPPGGAGSTTIINQFANPSDYLPVNPAPPPSQSAYLPISPTRAELTPAPTAYLPLSPVATTRAPIPASLLKVGDPPPAAFLPLSSTVGSANKPQAVPTSNFLLLGQNSATFLSAQIPTPIQTSNLLLLGQSSATFLSAQIPTATPTSNLLPLSQGFATFLSAQIPTATPTSNLLPLSQGSATLVSSQIPTPTL